LALTRKDATIVMGMLARGDHNHHVAAWFGENPARIAEVKDGTAFGNIPAADPKDLPPKGAPGLKGRRLYAYARDALSVLTEKGDGGIEEAIRELRAGLSKFEAHEH
jgi:hypothetical protein